PDGFLPACRSSKRRIAWGSVTSWVKTQNRSALTASTTAAATSPGPMPRTARTSRSIGSAPSWPSSTSTHPGRFRSESKIPVLTSSGQRHDTPTGVSSNSR
ncbi:MAG TPA: hypothetical protein DDZ64_00230, partial [Acidimicrobiaceae bacterium]|nr:hypothetical protein [Acidimicrobiaceae bacterium]